MNFLKNVFKTRKHHSIVAGAFYIPKYSCSKPRGEDAHFFSKVAQVIGVADGVGAWSSKGIDAGEYARELMTNAANAVEDLTPLNVKPKVILQDIYLNTVANGTATACIISVAGKHLRAVILGDSGFIILRKGRSIFRSPVQQKGFNRPYQMGRSKGRLVGEPEAAKEVTVRLKKRDVIVAGTDGLFDNLFEEEIAQLVSACVADKDAAEVTARKLAVAARDMALTRVGVRPYGVASMAAGKEHARGKYDDITMVVAYVV